MPQWWQGQATFYTAAAHPLVLAATDTRTGVDVVMHSVTKYLSGHSDVLMGALATSSAELYERLRKRRTLGGTITILSHSLRVVGKIAAPGDNAEKTRQWRQGDQHCKLPAL